MAVVRRMVFALTVITIVTMIVAFSPPSAAVTTSKIGPRQHYVGLVNAKPSGAVIHVACPGPSGRTGPPTGGQTVNVKRVSSGSGYTGSAAHEIWAQFGRDGAFPFLAQVTPPATVEDAMAMVKDHAAAGVDGLILTYPGELPDAFLEGRDVVKALIES